MPCYRFMLRRLAFVVCLLVLMTGRTWAAEVLEITPRSGVTLRMLVDAPADIKAVALLFPGGHGKVRVQENASIKGLKGNFRVRMRGRFTENGFAMAIRASRIKLSMQSSRGSTRADGHIVILRDGLTGLLRMRTNDKPQPEERAARLEG